MILFFFFLMTSTVITIAMLANRLSGKDEGPKAFTLVPTHRPYCCTHEQFWRDMDMGLIPDPTSREYDR